MVVACLLFAACSSKKNEAPKKQPEKVVEQAPAPKKPVPTTPLPALAADPGGASGKPIWQTGFGGMGIDAPRGVAVGADGNVYVCGYLDGDIDFGGTIGKKPSAGGSDAFVVKLTPDVVVDTSGVGQLFGASELMPIVAQYDQHPITAKMNQVATLFPYARTVEPGSVPGAKATVTTLVETSAQSFATTHFANNQVRVDPVSDRHGPLPLGVAGEAHAAYLAKLAALDRAVTPDPRCTIS